MTRIDLLVHSSGIDGQPLHLPGQGGPDCGTCHPARFPAHLVIDPHAHRDVEAKLNINTRKIAVLADRVSVVEQILSDAIPPQPGEPGYDPLSASPTTKGGEK